MKDTQKQQEYNDIDWEDLYHRNQLSFLRVGELELYINHHNIEFKGKRDEKVYEGRSWTKCLTCCFVMAFHRFCTLILLVDSFSEFDSANCRFNSPFSEVDSSLREFISSSCQLDSSAGLFDSSFYEFDSSLTTLVHRFIMAFYRSIIVPLKQNFRI